MGFIRTELDIFKRKSRTETLTIQSRLIVLLLMRSQLWIFKHKFLNNVPGDTELPKKVTGNA